MGRWPGLLAVASKYQGKPVAFIAVNSGNTKKEVAAYISRHKVPWPTIVDSGRMFEKVSLSKEISLKNIGQYRTINSEGEIGYASSGDLDKAITGLLDDASWNIDPEGFPKSMMATWRAIEFGNFQSAASGVKKATRNSNPEMKAAGDKLNEYVQKQIAELLTVASEAQEQDDLWMAYTTYSQVKDSFKGYQMETDLLPILKKLKKEPTVINELAAKKLLDAVRRRSVTSKSAYKAAVVRLKKIVEKYPKTEAARLAGEMLESKE